MSTDEIYSEELEIASVHEPFRTALIGALKDRERTRKLLYRPPFSTVGFTAPASLLVITDKRWLVILQEESEPYVGHATFDVTLLVELSIILLNGQLKLDYVKEVASVPTAVQFDIVSKRNYFEAVESVLAGMEARPVGTPVTIIDPSKDIKNWPLKFRNIAAEYLPRGGRISSGVYCETLYGGFGREIAPAGALICKNVSVNRDEFQRAQWFWGRRPNKLILSMNKSMRIGIFYILLLFTSMLFQNQTLAIDIIQGVAWIALAAIAVAVFVDISRYAQWKWDYCCAISRVFATISQ